MIATLEALLLECWEDLELRRERPARLHAAKLSHEEYPPAASPLLFLLFADREARPVAVAKVARVAAGDAHVEREARALAGARRVLPPALVASVPRPIRSASVNGRACLLESALPGEVELHHTWHPSAVRRSLPRVAAALEWSARAAAATGAETVHATDWLGGGPEAILAGLGRLGCAPETLARLAGRRHELAAARWPAALSHGDFFPGNVLFGPGASGATGWSAVRVVDWMLAEERAPAFADALTYELAFSTQALHAGRRQSPEAIRAVNALEPFAAARAAWSRQGVETGLGSLARLATIAHAALRDGDPEQGRGRIGATWARLLDLETTAFDPQLGTTPEEGPHK